MYELQAGRRLVSSVSSERAPSMLLCGKLYFEVNVSLSVCSVCFFVYKSLRKALRTISSRGQSLPIFPCMLTHLTLYIHKRCLTFETKA